MTKKWGCRAEVRQCVFNVRSPESPRVEGLSDLRYGMLLEPIRAVAASAQISCEIYDADPYKVGMVAQGPPLSEKVVTELRNQIFPRGTASSVRFVGLHLVVGPDGNAGNGEYRFGDRTAAISLMRGAELAVDVENAHHAAIRLRLGLPSYVLRALGIKRIRDLAQLRSLTAQQLFFGSELRQLPFGRKLDVGAISDLIGFGFERLGW